MRFGSWVRRTRSLAIVARFETTRVVLSTTNVISFPSTSSVSDDCETDFAIPFIDNPFGGAGRSVCAEARLTVAAVATATRRDIHGVMLGLQSRGNELAYEPRTE